MLGTVESKGGQEPKKMSRRQFLKIGGIAAGAAVLATCVPQIEVLPTDEVKEPSSTPESQGGEALPTSTPEKEEVKPTGTPEVNLEGSSGAGGSLPPGIVERLNSGEFAGQQEAVKEWMSYFTSPLRGQTQYASPTLDKVPYMLAYDLTDLMEGEVALGAQDLLDQEMMVFPPALAWRYDEEGQFVGFARPVDVIGSGYATSGDIPVNYGPLRVSKSREAGATLPEMVGGRLAFVNMKGFVNEMMNPEGMLEVESRVNRRPREWRQEWERAGSYELSTWPESIQVLAKRSVEDWIARPEDLKSKEDMILQRFTDYVRTNEAIEVLGEQEVIRASAAMSRVVDEGTKATVVPEEQIAILLRIKAGMGEKVEERGLIVVSNWELEQWWAGKAPGKLDTRRKQGPSGTIGADWVGSWVEQSGMREYSCRDNMPTFEGLGVCMGGLVDFSGNVVIPLLIWRDDDSVGLYGYRVVEVAKLLNEESVMVAGGSKNKSFYGSATDLVEGGFGIQRTRGQFGKSLPDNYRDDLRDAWLGKNLLVNTRVNQDIRVGGVLIANCEAAHANGAEYLMQVSCRDRDKVTYPWEEGKVGWDDVLHEVKAFAMAMKKLASA